MDSYIIGLVASDGHVSRYRWQVSQGVLGLDVLEKIKKHIGSGYIKESKKSNSYSNVPMFNFFCNHDRQVFEEWGIPVGNKTYLLKFPSNKPEEDVWKYLRGFFDGDGSLHVDVKYPRIQIISNDLWCRACLKFLAEHKICSYYSPDKRHPNIGSIVIRRVNSVHDFMEKIYAEKGSLFLDRKFNIWEEIKVKYPRLKNERKTKVRITENLRSCIKDMLLSGRTIKDIASSLGISDGPVQRVYVHLTGGRAQKRREQEKTVNKLLGLGYNRASIRRETGIHDRVITHVLRERKNNEKHGI